MDQDLGGGLASGIAGSAFLMVYLAAIVLGFIVAWKVYEKAGKPGWAAIVPIYNLIVLLEIVGKPLWWVILFFIPVINVIAAFLIYLELSKRFGQGAGFAVGLLLLPFIFMAILAFGSAQYQRAPA